MLCREAVLWISRCQRLTDQCRLSWPTIRRWRPPRTKYTLMPNWNAVLEEINKASKNDPSGAHDKIRRKYLANLHAHTGRTVIAYYSGFLTKPRTEGIEITDEDKNGFMMCIHETNKENGLDLILHTPGGDGAATESLIHYLKEIYGRDLRAIVPQIAMSAGTIIACACKTIIMGKHSNLGPIDPQFSGIPAIGVITEIERAYEEIKKDQRYALVWNPILSRLTPSFVQQCYWAVERAKEYGAEVLRENMLANHADKERLANQIVSELSDLSKNKAHNRHIHHQDCERMGLNIEMLETDPVLQDLILTVHHCYMHTLSNTGAFKIIENHKGRAYVKIQQLIQFAQPIEMKHGPNAPQPSGQSG